MVDSSGMGKANRSRVAAAATGQGAKLQPVKVLDTFLNMCKNFWRKLLNLSQHLLAKHSGRVSVHTAASEKKDLGQFCFESSMSGFQEHSDDVMKSTDSIQTLRPTTKQF